MWGAALALLALVLAVVVRPAAQLTYLYGVDRFYGNGDGDGGYDGSSSGSFAVVDVDNGCTAAAATVAARAVKELKHLEAHRCPLVALGDDEGGDDGDDGSCKQLQRQKRQQHRKGEKEKEEEEEKKARSLSLLLQAVSKCTWAADHYARATQRLLRWFETFHGNGTVTCAHSQWFNVSEEAAVAVIAKPPVGPPVVMWHPVIFTSSSSSSPSPLSQHKLSLVVYSPLSRKEEMITQPAVANVSFVLATKGEMEEREEKEIGSGGNGGPSLRVASARFSGVAAHCVQWLGGAY